MGEPVHDPWQLVLLETADGSTVAARVWLPPLPGLPAQRVPADAGDAGAGAEV